MANPNGLTATQLQDLVTTTLRDLGPLKYTQIATPLQEYTAMSRLLTKNRVTLGSGVGIQFNVKVNLTNSFQNVGLGAADNVDIQDTMTTAQVDWRNSVTSWGWIGQEMSMNREPARIVDLIKSRRDDALIAQTVGMESNVWGPPVASDDSLTPWGIKTWIVKNATAGFNGGMPSGYTTLGLSTTTYPNWKNYTAPYTAITKDDLIRAWRTAARKINFKPPIKGLPTYNTGDSYGWYTTLSVLLQLEEALEAQNDNLGNDIASKDGMTTFHRREVEWVPALDADSTGPIYGINWGVFKLFILSGWWNKETLLPIYPGQHTVSAGFLDSTYNLVLKDRRSCCVLSNGTTEPA